MRTAKAWVAFLGAVLTGLTGAFADDVLDVSDAGTLGLAIIPAALTLWAVYKTRNAGAVNGSDPPSTRQAYR